MLWCLSKILQASTFWCPKKVRYVSFCCRTLFFLLISFKYMFCYRILSYIFVIIKITAVFVVILKRLCKFLIKIPSTVCTLASIKHFKWYVPQLNLWYIIEQVKSNDKFNIQKCSNYQNIKNWPQAIIIFL